MAVYLVFIGKVKDFSKWRPIFEENANIRKESGSKGGRIFHGADNPNELVIFFEWESVEKAKKFIQSEDLKKRMEQTGVIGEPKFLFLEEIGQVSA